MLRKISAYSTLARYIKASEELWQRTSPKSYYDYEGSGVSFTGDFPSLLRDFYKLEYVYSMLKNKPFKGDSRRRDNILKHVTNNFREVSYELGDFLEKVFSDWLSKHAITDPGAWAEARVSEKEYDRGYEDIYSDFVYEYARYAPELKGQQHRPGTYEILSRALFKAINKLPSEISNEILSLLVDQEAYLNDHIIMLLEEWEDDPETVTDRLGLSPDATEDEVRDAAEQDAENIDYAEYVSNMDIGDAIRNIDPDDAHRFLVEVGAKVVFPVWYAYWSEQGIDETRDNIEEIHAKLANPSPDLGKYYADVNQALNAAHQTGEMLEYVTESVGSDEDIKGVLTELTEGEFTKQLDPLLRKSGVVL